MAEFVHPKPFTEELEADEQALQGRRTVDAQECDEIRILYANGREAVWLFSLGDRLPRQVHRLDRALGVEGRQTVTKLVVDPAVDDGSFHLETPNGYRVTSEAVP
jgi:hypothetical protein